MSSHIKLTRLAALTLGLTLALTAAAGATTTTVARYNIGESDLDAGNLPAVAGSTPGAVLEADIGTDATLRYAGTATFSANAAPGSTLSLMITGGGPNLNRDYTAPTSVSTSQLSTNWGIEAWLWVPAADSGEAIYQAYSLGNGAAQDWHLIRDAGVRKWQFTNGTTLGPITTETWLNTAVVVDDTTVQWYLNGVSVHTENRNAGWNGNATIDDLWIGTSGSYGSNRGWEGGIDRVRLFTFDSGAFNPLTDLGQTEGPAVPEPSTFVLAALGLAGLGLLVWRRRGDQSDCQWRISDWEKNRSNR